MSDAPRFRFAPSPTGFFHVGGARTALTTGRWPAGSAARSCCASRTPTRPATGRSGRRASSTRWPGSASAPTTRRSRARTSRAHYAAAHVAAADAAVRARPRLLLRPDRRADPGARQGERASPATTATRATAGSDPGPGRVLRFRVPDAARPSSTTSSAARSTFDNEHDRGLRAAARQRHADVPARQRRRRHRDGHHPRRARPRSTCPTRPSSSCCGRRSATSRRCGRTCRCSSTSSARSCRSGATRWRSSSTATRATSPTRWSTT